MSNNKNALNACSKGCNILQPKEELCLSAYVDGECGWLKRIFAKRALSNSFEARRFVDELERTSEQIQRSYSTELNLISEDVSLWPRISARIAQEERLTLLRSIPIESGIQYSWASRLAWSGLGAVAASMLILVYSPFSSGKNNPELAANNVKIIGSRATGLNDNSGQSFDQNSLAHVAAVLQDNPSQSGFSRISDDEYRALQLAAMQGKRAAGSTLVADNMDSRTRDPGAWRFLQQQPQFIESDRGLAANQFGSLDQSSNLSLSNQRRAIAPQVFEADWMRSNGRVRVLQDPAGSSAIIWIHRPRALANGAVPAAVNHAPTGNLEFAGVGNRK